MLLAFLAQVTAAGALAITSPTKPWAVTITQGGAQAQHIDVVLKNPTRTPMLWHLMDLPPWADCLMDSDHPELGPRLEGWVDPGKTTTVRVDLAAFCASYAPGSYVWDIAFLADGSAARETFLECTLTVLAPP